MLAIIIALNIGIAFIASNSDFKFIDATYATSTPKSAPQPDKSIQEHVIGIMQNEFNLSWPEIAEAISIISCESSFNPYAIGDSGKSTGLWQIHSGYHKDITTEQTFDVYASTRWAIKKYIASGRSWKIWSCANKI